MNPETYECNIPVVPVHREGPHWVFMEPCPYCGRHHCHGAGASAGHVAAHCPDRVDKKGNFLGKTPGTAQGYILKEVEFHG